MKAYNELKIQLVVLQAQDIVTMSGFGGEVDEFENPNANTNNIFE